MGKILVLLVISPLVLYIGLSICEHRINKRYNCPNKGAVKML